MRRAKRQSGFGIADLLGSMAVVSLVLVGGFAFTGRLGDTVSFGGAQVMATRLAQEVLERASAEDFDALGTSSSVCSATPQAVTASNSSAANGTVFTRTCTVTVAEERRKLLLVSVTWGGGDDSHRIQLAGSRLR